MIGATPVVTHSLDRGKGCERTWPHIATNITHRGDGHAQAPEIAPLLDPGAKVYLLLSNRIGYETFVRPTLESDTVNRRIWRRSRNYFRLEDIVGDRTLEDYHDLNGIRIGEPSVPSSTGMELPAWFSFAFGGVVTFLLVYIGIARPNALELSQLRSQLAALDQSVSKLAGHSGTTNTANNLLGQLSEQARLSGAAAESLEEIRCLHQQLEDEGQQLRQARQTLAQIVGIKNDLVRATGLTDEATEMMLAYESLHERLAQSSKMAGEAKKVSDGLLAIEQDLLCHGYEVEAAHKTLSDLASLKNDLVRAGDQTDQATATMSAIESLQARLAESADTTAEARAASDELIALEQDLLCHGYEVETAQETLSTLSSLKNDLVRASSGADAATAAMSAIESLQTRLTQSTVTTSEARTVSDELLALKDDLLIHGYEVDTARETLSDLACLKDDLVQAQEGTQTATAAMSTIQSLFSKLADSADAALDAQWVGNQLLTLQQDLLGQQYEIAPAQKALDGLVSIRKELATEGDQIEDAQQRAEGLLTLKDTVVTQTRDLADAIETLELTSDLHDQFHEAALSFGQIRSWMVELAMLQPTFQRAMDALQPLTELGNLRRLDDGQLRDVAEAMRERGPTQLARKTSLSDEMVRETEED